MAENLPPGKMYVETGRQTTSPCLLYVSTYVHLHLTGIVAFIPLALGPVGTHTYTAVLAFPGLSVPHLVRGTLELDSSSK